MAIWDRQEDTVITSTADSYKCLSCGANVLFDPKEGVLVCRSCGNRHHPEAYEVNSMLGSLSEGEANVDDTTKHQIVCNACGSTVITDAKTMSTFCAFCGSPAVVNRPLDKAFTPDYIIPYKLTHKDAEDAIKKWSSTRKFLPGSFNSKANYSKITGLYVPFWVVDAECHVDTVGSGIMKRMELGNEFQTYYDVKRKADFKMLKVPFDGSKKINDRVMQAIEPFDYREMVPFNIGYLQGFYAERYDENPQDISVKVTNRLHDYMYEISSKYMNIGKYHEYHLEQNKSKADHFDFKYALMPVWFMSYKYKNLYYRIAVNGQTGEVAGKTPESGFKLGMFKFLKGLKAYSLVILADLIIAAVLAMAMYFYMGARYSGSHRHSALSIGICFVVSLAICLGLTLCNALGIRFMDDNSIYGRMIEKMVIKTRMDIIEYGNDINKLDEMPDAYQYFDKSQKVDVIEEDNVVTDVMTDSLHMGENDKRSPFGFGGFY